MIARRQIDHAHVLKLSKMLLLLVDEQELLTDPDALVQSEDETDALDDLVRAS